MKAPYSRLYEVAGVLINRIDAFKSNTLFFILGLRRDSTC